MNGPRNDALEPGADVAPHSSVTLMTILLQATTTDCGCRPCKSLRHLAKRVADTVDVDAALEPPAEASPAGSPKAGG